VRAFLLSRPSSLGEVHPQKEEEREERVFSSLALSEKKTKDRKEKKIARARARKPRLECHQTPSNVFVNA